MKVTLYAHPDYWKLTKEEKKDICNGIGAKGAWYNFLIPSSIKRVFKESGNIHDFDYFKGKNENDKKQADRRFSQNNKRIVDAIDNKALKVIAKRVAKSMYLAVDKLGDDAYWKEKIVDEKNSEGREVTI